MKYYVYLLIDPRTNLPFYIGKGKNKRADSHLKETKETTLNIRKFNKIQSIVANGLEPIIKYHVENINESAAYDIEANLIKLYGRAGYDINGILTNICTDNRPPGNDNFKTKNPSIQLKGKTYEEIHGIDKANILKEKRKLSSTNRTITDEWRENMSTSAIQKMKNGYVMPSRKGKTDSAETKLKKSLAHTGKIKGPLSDEIKQKISETKRLNKLKIDKP